MRCELCLDRLRAAVLRLSVIARSSWPLVISRSRWAVARPLDLIPHGMSAETMAVLADRLPLTRSAPGDGSCAPSSPPLVGR